MFLTARRRAVLLVVGLALIVSLGALGWQVKGGKLFSKAATTTSGQSFSDVPIDHPYYLTIEAAYRAGMMNGYSDGTFRPNGTMTQDQIAVILARAMAGGDLIVVPNPSFEANTGWNFCPWKHCVNLVGYYGYSKDMALDGTQSAKMTFQGNGSDLVYADVTGLDPGTTYTVSANVYRKPGFSGNVKIWLHDTNGQNSVSSAYATLTGQWEKLTVNYKANDTGKVRIHLYTENPTYGSTLYWDLVKVEPAGFATFSDIPKDNQINKYVEYLVAKKVLFCTTPGKCRFNPSIQLNRELATTYIGRALSRDIANQPSFNFEDQSGWHFCQWGKCTSSGYSGEKVIDGTNSAKVVFNGTGSDVVWRDVTGLIPGMTYTVKAMVYQKSGFSGKARIWLHDAGLLGGNSVNSANAPAAFDQWSSLQVTYTADSTGKVRIHLLGENPGSGSTLYWDVVSVELGVTTSVLSSVPVVPIPAKAAKATFADVPVDYQAFKYIEYLAGVDLIEGETINNQLVFKPDDPALRGWTADLVSRAFDLINTALVANVSGRVTDVSGAPLANAYLLFNEGEAMVQADANGNYSLTGLYPTTYEVEIIDQNGNLYESPDLNDTSSYNTIHIVSPNYGNNTINFSGLVKK